MSPEVASALSQLGAALLLPVLLGLALMAGATLLILGGWLRELAERRGMRRSLEAALARSEAEGCEAGVAALRGGLAGQYRRARGRGLSHEAALTEVEQDAADRLARTSGLTRLAPMFGLMGTLIPLGPALEGLAAGRIDELAMNLVVAFTTTDIGLAISAAAFTVGLCRQRWYDKDLSQLERLEAPAALEAAL